MTAFVTQPQFVYSHRWRDGDGVMWENRYTLHRTIIAGKSPDSAFATMLGA